MSTIVVAYEQSSRAIGAGGELLWHLPNDLRHFSRVTKGGSVIMGRTTWESLPEAYRPLPNRQNIVMSLSQKALEGVEIAQSLDEALELARFEPFIIGGGQIYEQALPRAQKIIATEVLARTAEADTFFPEIDMSEWRVAHTEHYDADVKNLHPHTFVTYERTA